jgi:hypothetical protein
MPGHVLLPRLEARGARLTGVLQAAAVWRPVNFFSHALQLPTMTYASFVWLLCCLQVRFEQRSWASAKVRIGFGACVVASLDNANSVARGARIASALWRTAVRSAVPCGYKRFEAHGGPSTEQLNARAGSGRRGYLHTTCGAAIFPRQFLPRGPKLCPRPCTVESLHCPARRGTRRPKIRSRREASSGVVREDRPEAGLSASRWESAEARGPGNVLYGMRKPASGCSSWTMARRRRVRVLWLRPR